MTLPFLTSDKKGLWPVLKAARLADRYDMAVIAAEGYANEAARTLFQQADEGGEYQLFVLHDADPHGYNIARTLREETKRMPGYQVDVIDLGLDLEEALDLGMETEEFTRKKALPEGLELTEPEERYFIGRQVTKKSWVCERVELNAFSAPDLVDYIERKLKDAGATDKVIPDDEALTDEVKEFYESEIEERVNQAISLLLWTTGIKAEIRKQFEEKIDLDRARDWIADAFEENDALSWRAAVESKLEEQVGEHHNDIEAAVKEKIINHLKGMSA